MTNLLSRLRGDSLAASAATPWPPPRRLLLLDFARPEDFMERIERGTDRGGRIGLDRVQGLEPESGDVEDHALVGRNHSLVGETLERRNSDATGGLGEDAFGASQQPDPLDDLAVADGREPALGLTHGVEREVAVGGVSDRERLRDRVRLDRPDRVGTLTPRGRDR